MIILQFSRANDSNCIRQHALPHNFPLMCVTLCWLSKVREKERKRESGEYFRHDSEANLETV